MKTTTSIQQQQTRLKMTKNDQEWIQRLITAKTVSHSVAITGLWKLSRLHSNAKRTADCIQMSIHYANNMFTELLCLSPFTTTYQSHWTTHTQIAAQTTRLNYLPLDTAGWRQRWPWHTRPQPPSVRCTCRICHYANIHSDQISAEPQVRQHHCRPERQRVAAVSAQSIRLGLQIMLQVNWWLKQQIDITRINYNCIARFSSIAAGAWFILTLYTWVQCGRTYAHVAHANADNKRTYCGIFQRTVRISTHVNVHPYDDVIMIRYKLTNYKQNTIPNIG